MQEIGLPCSVITSHGELLQNSAVVLDQVAYNMPLLDIHNDATSAVQHPTDDGSTLSDTAVFELVDMKVWPSTTSDILQETNSHTVMQQCDHVSRKRKLKRPYSPVMTTPNRKFPDKKKNFTKLKIFQSDVTLIHDDSVGKPFSCDKCKSPYVVNPARSHLSNTRKKNHRPRKAIDPITKKHLLLCNACGLAMRRPKKEKQKKVQPSEEAKRRYLEESINFGATLAETLQEPDANRLYCPSFKMQPCRCLQNYITNKGMGESKKRAMLLLNLLKDAKNLSKRKNVIRTCKEPPEEVISNETQIKNKVQVQRGFLKRKSPLFEDFVLTKRLYLRNEIGLCERACQKILMYSNNFLHKRLKSSPDKGPRIQRMSGKNARGLLKPISMIANETCCSDKCVLLALTHSKLLESWRVTARLGQQEARRVLAEMLTPSGGTKANCYKFISMVTGCSHTTICLVSEHMRRTQGDREPPEHGLKKWWRQHAKDKDSQRKPHEKLGYSCDGYVDDDDISELGDIHIPSEEELQMLDPKEASRQLQIQRKKLIKLKKQLEKQQQKLQGIQQPESGQNQSVIQSKNTSGHCANGNAKLSSQQLLHFLEIPSTTSTVTAVSDSSHPQPAISVMTASGDFEPLTNISVSLAGGNVVILPESVLEAPVVKQSSVSADTSGLTYTSNLLESDSGSVVSVPASQPHTEFNLVPAVFSSGNKECCDLPRLYYMDT